jgi:hypothetical protein
MAHKTRFQEFFGVTKEWFASELGINTAMIPDSPDKRYVTDAEKDSIANPSAGSGGVTDHAELSNLEYENAGHTGFEPALGFTPAEEFSPADLPNLFLWLRADLGVTLTGGRVTGLADQSGLANNWAPVGGIQGPTITNNVLNGHPVITFDGASLLGCSSMGAYFAGKAAPLMMFIVIRTTYDGTQEFLFLNQGPNQSWLNWHLLGWTGNGMWQTFCEFSSDDPLIQYDPASSVDNYNWQNMCMFTGKINGNWQFMSIRESGLTVCDQVEWNLPSNVSLTHAIMGGRMDAGFTNPSTYFTGDVAEIIMLSQPLNDSRIAEVEQYLAKRYGLSGHGGMPYRFHTPMGTNRICYGSNYPYLLNNSDHHIVAVPTDKDVTLHLPDTTNDIDRVGQREYIISRSATAENTKVVKIQPTGTVSLLDVNQVPVSEIVLSERFESITLKGSFNFTDAIYGWQVTASTRETPKTIGGLINASSVKSTPIDADKIALADSEAANILSSLSLSDLKAFLKEYFDDIYVQLSPPS